MPAAENLSPQQFKAVPVPDYVDKRQSGGIGHLPGDESRSVVGMVPTSALIRYREHDGNQQKTSYGHEDDVRIINGIREDIRNGGGIRNPLMLEYDKRTQHASLGEGNHRLAAALAERVSHVPVRVYGRASLGPGEARHGAFLGGTISPVHPADPSYMAPEVHPHHWSELR